MKGVVKATDESFNVTKQRFKIALEPGQPESRTDGRGTALVPNA